MRVENFREWSDRNFTPKGKKNSEMNKQFWNELNRVEDRIGKLKAMSIIKTAEVKAENKKEDEEVEEKEWEEEKER